MLEKVIRNIVNTFEPIKKDWLDKYNTYATLNMFLTEVSNGEVKKITHSVHELSDIIENLILEFVEVPENKKETLHLHVMGVIFRWSHGFIETDKLLKELSKYKVKKQP